MREDHSSDRLTAGELRTAALLRAAPWLAFLFVALPLPLYFLFRYFTAADDVAVYMLFALTTLAGGALAGLLVGFLLLLYRWHWERGLRRRLAADGITVSELRWFASELKPAERRALRQIEAHNALLADAYRETLAARLTAAHVAARCAREAAEVDERRQRVGRLEGAARATLDEELRADRERLAETRRAALEHQAAAETRLQMIEATASRDASEAEIEQALARLDATREAPALSLEAARLELEARAQARKELREGSRPSSG